MTPRVKKLQENLETISDEGVFFERAVLLLEAERAHRNDPNDIKYVRCLQHLLENMTVDIRDDELIVGMCREEILMRTSGLPQSGSPLTDIASRTGRGFWRRDLPAFVPRHSSGWRIRP